MLKRLMAAAAAAALFTAALPAAAASPGPAPAAAANPQGEALVRRYLAAIHFERTMDSVQAAILPVISAQSGPSGLSDEDRQLVVGIMRKEMREKMVPQMIDRMVPIYAATFSVAELEAMVRFYESPVGRSITDKIPSLAPKSAEITQELIPQMMRDVVTEVITKLCAEKKCDAARLPKPAAS